MRQGINHLVLRHGIYYFRIAIPKRLQGRFRKEELKYSLRTVDKLHARQLCRSMSSNAETLFEFITSMPDLTEAQVQEISRNYFRALLEDGNELVWCLGNDPITSQPRDPNLDRNSEAEDALENESRYRTLREKGLTPPGIRSDVSNALAKIGFPDVKQSQEAFDLLCQTFMRAKVESYRVLAAKLLKQNDKEMPLDAMFAGIISTTLPAVAGQSNAVVDNHHSLDVLTDKYLSVNAGKWKGKTKLDQARSMRLLKELLGGELNVVQLTTAHVVKVRDALCLLPKNYEKKVGKLGIKELITKEGERISPKTAEKYLGMVKSFLIWLENEGYITKAPGKNVHVIYKETEKPRLPFSMTQLEKLFSSPLFRGYQSQHKRYKPGSLLTKDAEYWIPLLAIFSGLRLGEIIQTLTSDVKKQGEINFIDLAETEGSKKKLKTKYSHRRVPVHPVLVALGFMEFVESRRNKHQYLFHEFACNEKQPGTKYGKCFSRYLKNSFIKTPKTTFHSFRHNFTDALDKNSVHVTHKYAMLGHTGSEASAHYGETLPIAVLYESIKKVRYDFETLFPEYEQLNAGYGE